MTAAPNPVVAVGQGAYRQSRALAIIAGPCQMESRAHALEMARRSRNRGAAERRPIYKTSFDKANRTSASAHAAWASGRRCRLRRDPRELGLPVLTDVHEIEQCAPVAEAIDVLQIPAFLCRQTDLLVAAAQDRPGGQRQEGPVPGAVGHEERDRQDRWRRQSERLASERGVSFGYNTLVSDMRALPIMAQIGCPVVFDATHSVQQPGGQGTARAASASSCRCWPARPSRSASRRVHGDPSRPGPRAFGRPEHGAAQGLRAAGAASCWSSTPWPRRSRGGRPGIILFECPSAALAGGRKNPPSLRHRPGVPPLLFAAACGVKDGPAEITPVEPVWVMPAKGAALTGTNSNTSARPARRHHRRGSHRAWHRAGGSPGRAAVTVFERGKAGAGASHAAAGMLAACCEAEPGEEALVALGRESQARWPGFAAELLRATGHRRRIARRGHVGPRPHRGRSGRDRPPPGISAAARSAARMAVGGADEGARAAPRRQDRRRRVLAAGPSGRQPQAGAGSARGTPRPPASPSTSSGRWKEILVQARPREGRRPRATARSPPPRSWCWPQAPGRAASAGCRPIGGRRCVRSRGRCWRCRWTRRRRCSRTVLWAPGAYLVPRRDGRLIVGATVEEQGFDDKITAGGMLTLLEAALARGARGRGTGGRGNLGRAPSRKPR